MDMAKIMENVERINRLRQAQETAQKWRAIIPTYHTNARKIASIEETQRKNNMLHTLAREMCERAKKQETITTHSIDITPNKTILHDKADYIEEYQAPDSKTRTVKQTQDGNKQSQYRIINGTIYARGKDENGTFYPIGKAHTDKRELSEMAQAYLRYNSVRLTYRALATIYQRSGQDDIRRLMNDTIRLGKSYGYNHIQNIVDEKHKDKTQIQRVSTYTMVKDANGKRHKMLLDCDEWILKTTEYGQETLQAIDATAQDAANIDAEDLVQTAFLSLWTLANDGLITCYSDMQVYAHCVYRAINTAVMREKRAQAKAGESFEKLVTIISGDDASGTYTEQTLFGRNAKSVIDDFEISETITAIAAYIAENSGKRTAKARALIAKVFLLQRQGYTQTETARLCGISQNMVSLYQKDIENMRYSADFRDFVHDLIAK